MKLVGWAFKLLGGFTVSTHPLLNLFHFGSVGGCLSFCHSYAIVSVFPTGWDYSMGLIIDAEDSSLFGLDGGAGEEEWYVKLLLLITIHFPLLI